MNVQINLQFRENETFSTDSKPAKKKTNFLAGAPLSTKQFLDSLRIVLKPANHESKFPTHRTGFGPTDPTLCVCEKIDLPWFAEIGCKLSF